MIADNLAFCHECHSIFEMQKDKNGEPVKVRRKKKTYKEIAMLNEMSEEESVRVSLERVYKYIRNNLKS
jgi:DNA-directed RNA polymerase subunit M/transcription elongation factor TFIIS